MASSSLRCSSKITVRVWHAKTNCFPDQVEDVTKQLLSAHAWGGSQKHAGVLAESIDNIKSELVEVVGHQMSLHKMLRLAKSSGALCAEDVNFIQQTGNTYRFLRHMAEIDLAGRVEHIKKALRSYREGCSVVASDGHCDTQSCSDPWWSGESGDDPWGSCGVEVSGQGSLTSSEVGCLENDKDPWGMFFEIQASKSSAEQFWIGDEVPVADEVQVQKSEKTVEKVMEVPVADEKKIINVRRQWKRLWRSQWLMTKKLVALCATMVHVCSSTSCWRLSINCTAVALPLTGSWGTHLARSLRHITMASSSASHLQPSMFYLSYLMLPISLAKAQFNLSALLGRGCVVKCQREFLDAS